MRMRSMLPSLCLAGAFALAGCAATDSGDADFEALQEARPTMAKILESLRVALPLSLSDERFSDPANRETLRRAFGTLAENSAYLESHADHLDPGFGYLSRSLADDARAVALRFDEQRFPEARFLLGQLTENCVACHSRLPSPEASGLGRQLLDEADIAYLEPVERVRLEVATRQFDTALDTYESLFRSGALSPAQLDLEGLLVDYLIVAIRVKGDLVRPRTALTALARRPDTPRYLRGHIDSWLAAMDEIQRMPRVGSGLDRARGLIVEAQRRSSFPADRSVLIQDLVASSELHRYVGTRSEPSPDLAEAYYLLGVTDARIHRSWWISEADFYLETAIRMDPRGPFAADAYDQLEEQTLSGYGGSSGIHVPADELERLEELRKLVDAP